MGDGAVVGLVQGGELHTDAVVVAAGVDTPRLLPDLPIRPEARYLFFSGPIRERLLEPLVVSPERSFAAKQLADGRVLASDLGALGDPETNQADWRANVRNAIEELLPQLVFVALPALIPGIYDVTPDHQAILGRVRDHVWVAAGFSGRGFMLAPAVGRIIAESVLGESEDPALGVLDAGRFADGRQIPEQVLGQPAVDEPLDAPALGFSVRRPKLDASCTGVENSLGVAGDLLRRPCKGEAVEDVVGDQPARAFFVARGNERSHPGDQIRFEYKCWVQLRHHREIHGDLAPGDLASTVAVLVDNRDRAEHDPDARVGNPVPHHGNDIRVRAAAHFQLLRGVTRKRGEAL